MRYAIVISAILLSACAPVKKTDPRSIHGVDPAFIPYLNQYLSYKGHALYYDIPIQFADLGGSTVGLCSRWSSGYRQIQVDRDYWSYADEGHKQELIDHELGHCDLGRDHVYATDAIGDPISIMYPYVFGIYTSADFTYYMHELFHPAPGTIEQPSIELSCVVDIDDEQK